jgi:death-on-curing protein
MAHLIGACQRPNNHWHYDGIEDIVSLSVVLLFGIAKNHPFIQGNKRTGFAAMVMFLQDNGYELSVSDDVRLADDIIKVIEGKMSEGEFEHKLRRVVTVIDERTW